MHSRPPRAQLVWPRSGGEGGPQLLDPRLATRLGRAEPVRVEAVQGGSVRAEDLRLHRRREGRVAELVLHALRDGEGAEGVNEELGWAVPDRVGAPQDAVLPDGPQQLAQHVGRLAGAPEHEEPGAAELGPDVRTGRDPGLGQALDEAAAAAGTP